VGVAKSNTVITRWNYMIISFSPHNIDAPM
jgi:hypothetical protein